MKKVVQDVCMIGYFLFWMLIGRVIFGNAKEYLEDE